MRSHAGTAGPKEARVRRLPLPMILALLAAAAPGCASKPAVPPDGFLVAHAVEIGASPDVVYAALGKIDRWWDDEHTWSGSARNLTLDLQAGGCMCERWESGSVEHARVVAAQPGQLLRLHGALGPLQELAVSGSLSFALQAEGAGTKLTLTYRVSGDSQHGLDTLKGVVGSVMEAQVERLKKFVETGKPE